MNIKQIEKYYSAFYKGWKKEAYWELMNKLQVTENQKISKMSCGQRSQVALGLLLAQNPDLLILDDYSMGLDAGYRRLFIDYLAEYIKAEGKTIFITSHIIQDLEHLLDNCVILDYKTVLLTMRIQDFLRDFKQYRLEVTSGNLSFVKNEVIKNFEVIKNKVTLYSFSGVDEIELYLKNSGVEYNNLKQVEMSLEDAFIGLTGKY
jgi:ABC-2 type transport system ATP-binding protein